MTMTKGQMEQLAHAVFGTFGVTLGEEDELRKMNREQGLNGVCGGCHSEPVSNANEHGYGICASCEAEDEAEAAAYEEAE